MDSIKDDVHFLARQLKFRLSKTPEEMSAADYVLHRLDRVLPDVRLITFDAIGNPRLIAAAYYGEFAVIGLIALWWPTLAFFYGLVIFLAYMAECMGIKVFSRFFPHFASSSVLGRRTVDTPQCLFVFSAHLDTNDAPFASEEVLWTRLGAHYMVIMAMVLVLAVNGVDALSLRYGEVNPLVPWLRWAGILFFLVLGLLALLRSYLSEPTQGATHNASGVAAVLHVAERLKKRPIKNAAIAYYLGGSHYANMEGMRTFLRENAAIRREVYLINIEGVGGGNLAYTESEGILRHVPCAPTLVDMAERRAKRYKAVPTRIHGFRSNAYLPLMHGVKAMTITGVDKTDLPVNHCAIWDIYERVQFDFVERAARFAESIARGIAKEHEVICDEADIPF